MAKKRELELLLIQARKFDNQTCRNAAQMSLWRLRVDKALEGVIGDDPEERWNEPGRIAHRAFIDSLFPLRRT